LLLSLWPSIHLVLRLFIFIVQIFNIKLHEYFKSIPWVEFLKWVYSQCVDSQRHKFLGKYEYEYVCIHV